ncbi:hypothetical protein ABMA32_06165 [Mesorhizobium sp. VNQ89]|uniref:hypothetical protein n=1 Tax=Mesorhizobium quangtriensis TaxID=3157709 RepID=UPI0032B76CAD
MEYVTTCCLACHLGEVAVVLRGGLVVLPLVLFTATGAVADDDCEDFSKSGLFSEAIITDEGPRDTPPASLDPAFDIRIVYPTAYLTRPESALDQLRRSAESFVITLDGTPSPIEERVTKRPNLFGGDNPSAFRLSVHDRYNLDKVIAVMTRRILGLPWSFDMPPLSTSPYSTQGLLEITNEKDARWRDKLLLVSISEGVFKDYIECDASNLRPHPQCMHYFDYRNIDVTMSYSIRLIPEWYTIRDLANRLLSCIYRDEIPTRTDGKQTWD